MDNYGCLDIYESRLNDFNLRQAEEQWLEPDEEEDEEDDGEEEV